MGIVAGSNMFQQQILSGHTEECAKLPASSLTSVRLAFPFPFRTERQCGCSKPMQGVSKPTFGWLVRLNSVHPFHLAPAPFTWRSAPSSAQLASESLA